MKCIVYYVNQITAISKISEYKPEELEGLKYAVLSGHSEASEIAFYAELNFEGLAVCLGSWLEVICPVIVV